MQTTKLKTNELIHAALHWAVAKCQGLQIYKDAMLDGRVKEGWWVSGLSTDPNTWHPLSTFNPSTNWTQGGPIIEQEGINVRAIRKEDHALNGQWLAAYDHGNTGTLVQWVKRTDFPKHYFPGSTPLIAAMRCYVASKLGDEIDIPDDVCQLGSS